MTYNLRLMAYTTYWVPLKGPLAKPSLSSPWRTNEPSSRKYEDIQIKAFDYGKRAHRRLGPLILFLFAFRG